MPTRGTTSKLVMKTRWECTEMVKYQGKTPNCAAVVIQNRFHIYFTTLFGGGKPFSND
jgi:hypothetical protein